MFQRSESISIALDHWTSLSTESYIGINAQAIDDCFNLQTRLIGFRKDSNHTALGTSLAAKSVLEQFMLNEKLSGAVGDAASSMVAALKLITNESTHGKLGTSVSHVCFAHVLQRSLIVSFNQQPTVSEVIKRTKDFVSFVDHSPKFLEYLSDFRIAVEEGSFQEGLLCKPKPPVSTR